MPKGKMQRNKRKNKGGPLSMFVRGKISAKQYWDMTGQSSKTGLKDLSN